MKRTFKTVCSRKELCCSKLKTVLRENYLNRESKGLDLTIYLYRCYDEHEAPINCNAAIYLSLYNKHKLCRVNMVLTSV